jgi:micrococcal nuclease
LLLTAILLVLSPAPLHSGSREIDNGAREIARVIDGDTIVLIPHERVRLIGVDTPESVHPKKAVECFGREAKEFTRRMAAGKKIRLELDRANVATGHKDRYGRTLGYVYLEDGVLLNAEIIRRGYGHAYTRFPFRHLEEFRALQREARAKGLGLWSGCGGKNGGR